MNVHPKICAAVLSSLLILTACGGGGGGGGEKNQTQSVTAANNLPLAVNDAYTTDEDQPLTVAKPGVLGNDSDTDGNALTAVLVAGPAHGTLTLTPKPRRYLPAWAGGGASCYRQPRTRDPIQV